MKMPDFKNPKTIKIIVAIFIVLIILICVYEFGKRSEENRRNISNEKSTSSGTETVKNNTSSTLNTSSTNKGITASWQTLTDTSSGNVAAKVLVPDGWTVSITTNWNIIDTGFPCLVTISFVSNDDNAMFMYSSPLKYYQNTTNNAWIPATGDDGNDLKNYQTLLTYRDAVTYQEYSLNKRFSDGITKTLDLKTDTTEQQRLKSSIKAVGDEGITQIYNTYRSAGQNVSASLDDYDATIALSQYSCNYGGSKCSLEAMTAVVQTTTTITLPATGISQKTISWMTLGDCFYMANSEEMFNKHYDEYQLIRDNVTMDAKFMYLISQYGNQIRNAITKATTEALKEMTERTAESLTSDYESSSSTSDNSTDAMTNYIFDQDTYELDDGSKVTVPNTTGGVYQNGDRIYIGNEADAPVGFEKKNVLY